MLTGRNKLCPCGSGKKYKKCCLNKSTENPSEFLWRQIGQTNKDMTCKILQHTVEFYGKNAIYDAWEEFHSVAMVEFDPEHYLMPIFMPWFLFNWQPNEYGDIAYLHNFDENNPALFFLEKQENKLSRLERAYIIASSREALTFWEIIDCLPGQGFTLKDIFLDRELYVIEKSGSQNAQNGDILFGKCVTAEGLTTLESCSHFLISPIHKLQLIDFREEIEEGGPPLSIEELQDYDFELIQIFLDIEQLSYDPKPDLQNTDGEKLSFNKVIFDIESVQQVFDSLKNLAGDTDDNILLKDAERNEAGELVKVQFNWNGQGNKMIEHWKTTILGDILIDRSRLTVSVNSKQRADRIKKIIVEQVPRAKYKITVMESVDAKLKEMQSQESSIETQAAKKKRQELEATPEVQEALEDMLRLHYDSWPDKELPALGGKTPRQAIITQNGKEKVDALLRHLERSSKDGLTLPDGIIKKLRQQLDLRIR